MKISKKMMTRLTAAMLVFALVFTSFIVHGLGQTETVNPPPQRFSAN